VTGFLGATTGLEFARPGLGVVLASGLIALLVTAILWWVVGHAITIAHEGGHALAAILVGGLVEYLWVTRKRDGETGASALSRLTVIPFTLAGYLAPSVFGLIAAAIVVLGRPAAVLWTTVVLLVLVLTVASTWFTRFAVVAVGMVFALVLRTKSDGVLLWVACSWTWLLLIGGLVHVVLHNGKGSDHHRLRELTWLPVWFWSFLFTFVALASLIFGFTWLTGMSSPPLPGSPGYGPRRF
jgi:hypothetical protein